MISFAVRHTLKGKAAIATALVPAMVFSALVAAPHAAFAQAAPESGSAALRTAPEATTPAQLLPDADASDPVGEAMNMALRLEADGAHTLAIAVVDEALADVRATYGLYSLEQAPWLERLIANEEARGNLAGAWDLEQELLELARRHPDDIRTVPVLREVAARREDILVRYLGGDFPEQIVFGCYYSRSRASFQGRNCRSGSRGVVVRRLLSEVRRYYGIAAGIILNQGLEYMDELREIDLALVRNSYRFGHFIGSYEVGRSSMVRLAALDAMNSEPLLTRVTSLVELIDWDLLFVEGATRKSRAERTDALVDRYERAHAMLEREDTPQALIDELFSPALPVVVPSFLPNPLATEETRRATPRYIDVAFVVTRLGNGDRIEILDTTQNATETELDDLIDLIESSRFRPRATNGEFVDSAPIVVRYHLNN